MIDDSLLRDLGRMFANGGFAMSRQELGELLVSVPMQRLRFAWTAEVRAEAEQRVRRELGR